MVRHRAVPCEMCSVAYTVSGNIIGSYFDQKVPGSTPVELFHSMTGLDISVLHCSLFKGFQRLGDALRVPAWLNPLTPGETRDVLLFTSLEKVENTKHLHNKMRQRCQGLANWVQTCDPCWHLHVLLITSVSLFVAPPDGVVSACNDNVLLILYSG